MPERPPQICGIAPAAVQLHPPRRNPGRQPHPARRRRPQRNRSAGMIHPRNIFTIFPLRSLSMLRILLACALAGTAALAQTAPATQPRFPVAEQLAPDAVVVAIHGLCPDPKTGAA